MEQENVNQGLNEPVEDTTDVSEDPKTLDKGKIDEIVKQSGHQSAQIRKLNKEIDALKSLLKDPPTSTGQKPKDEKFDTSSASEIERRIREREESLNKKYQKRARLHGIAAALESEGVSVGDSKRFAKLIEMEEEDNLQIANDDFDDWVLVGFKTSDGETISTQKWMKEYLNSDKGRSFKPVVKGPTPNTPRNGQGSVATNKKVISGIEYSKLVSQTPKDQRKALREKYEVID